VVSKQRGGKKQCVTFAVVIVKQHDLNVSSEANEAIASFQPLFPGIPLVLMAQDSRGIPTYYGRRDIADFMANVALSSIPWREYTVS
jgi:hypothetical protein